MKHYIDFIAEQLKTLTAIPSPSGYTKNANGLPDETTSGHGI